MTRGRHKDTTATPSRSLVNQRDYRARRALYVQDLEARHKRLEEENACLKKENALLHTMLLEVPSNGLQESLNRSKAAAELATALETALVSIRTFQEQTLGTVTPRIGDKRDTRHGETWGETADAEDQQSMLQPFSSAGELQAQRHALTSAESGVAPNRPASYANLNSSNSRSHSSMPRSWSPDPRLCCGGMVNCGSDSEDDVIGDDEEPSFVRDEDCALHP